jgi:hypothetical protein
MIETFFHAVKLAEDGLGPARELSVARTGKERNVISSIKQYSIK